MLSRFSTIPYPSIFDAVLRLDEVALDLEQLQILAQITPQVEEIELLKQYSEEIPPNLGAPEKFFVTMMSIPKLDMRLNCWLNKRTWNTQLQDLHQRIGCVLNATNQLKESKQFQTLLKVILEFGNYLNGSSANGQAWGFKLACLPMLLDVRSQVDSKMTLLHEIADHVAKEYSHVRANISAELSSISDAKNHTLSILLGDLSELRKNITNTTEYLQENPSAKDKFHVIMSPFLEKAKNEFDALEKKNFKKHKKFTMKLLHIL